MKVIPPFRNQHHLPLSARLRLATWRWRRQPGLEWTLLWAEKIEKPRLASARRRFESLYVNLDKYPLISITIATYNRADILLKRTLPTVFAQTYPNFEIIIVGDACSDDTEVRLARIGDNRIRFYNLLRRPNYPHNPKHRWMVAGSKAINLAMKMAKGLWIAHLDDDDCYLPQHLETLMKYAQETSAELVYSQMNKELEPGKWKVIGQPWEILGIPGFVKGSIPHSNVLFRSYLKLFNFNPRTWRINMAVDRHVWTRMNQADVQTAFLEEETTYAPLRSKTTTYSYLAEDRL